MSLRERKQVSGSNHRERTIQGKKTDQGKLVFPICNCVISFVLIASWHVLNVMKTAN